MIYIFLIFSFIFFFHYIFHITQTKENNFPHDFFSFPQHFPGTKHSLKALMCVRAKTCFAFLIITLPKLKVSYVSTTNLHLVSFNFHSKNLVSISKILYFEFSLRQDFKLVNFLLNFSTMMISSSLVGCLMVLCAILR